MLDDGAFLPTRGGLTGEAFDKGPDGIPQGLDEAVAEPFVQVSLVQIPTDEHELIFLDLVRTPQFIRKVALEAHADALEDELLLDALDGQDALVPVEDVLLIGIMIMLAMIMVMVITFIGTVGTTDQLAKQTRNGRSHRACSLILGLQTVVTRQIPTFI